MKSYQLQKGVGLVEVLVSLLVIAVGALGILGMQTQALKVAQETYYFNQANVAVNDLYERLRSNQRYAIEHSAYQTDYGKHLQSEENSEVKSCKNSKCSTQELAAWDLSQFKHNLQTNLIAEADAKIVMTEAKVGTSLSTKVTVSIRYPLTREFSTTGRDNYEYFTFETRI